jgi:hypothetical protein|tara:strand:- start:7628 stop:8332 length:705 start_codon:yes stop_codon:yes gene_type:complete
MTDSSIPVATNTTLNISASSEVGQLQSALVEFWKKGIEFLAQSTNPHFKSAYATLPFVIHMVKQDLASVGLVVVQGGGLVGNQFAVTTRLLHVSGEWMETVMPIQPSEKALAGNTSQAYASAMTYGRRIGLLSICGLAPVDPKEESLLAELSDDDGNAAGEVNDNPQAKMSSTVMLKDQRLRNGFVVLAKFSGTALTKAQERQAIHGCTNLNDAYQALTKLVNSVKEKDDKVFE